MKRRPLTAWLDRLFSFLELCWPGVIGGLVAGLLVSGAFGAIVGGLAALAGAIGGTWLHLQRGKKARLPAIAEVLAGSVGALLFVGIVFTAYVLLSWTKWLLAVAAVGVLAWYYLVG